MKRHMPLAPLAAILFLAGPAGGGGPLPGAARPRAVAVGDVHASYDAFTRVLRLAGIVDEKARWAGGKAHSSRPGTSSTGARTPGRCSTS